MPFLQPEKSTGKNPADEQAAMLVVAGPAAGPDVEAAVLRDFVESEARKDAASGMYDVNVGVHGHPLIMEHKIDRWHHRWSADAEIRQQNDRKTAAQLHRGATRSKATGEQTEEHLKQELGEATTYHNRMHAIVAGTEAGDDGGHWAAQSRIDESRRGEVAKDWAIYLGAAVAEVGLNYSAFQLMGSSLAETAVLAASIILVNVLLPKQLGELVARVRRARRDRGLLITGLVGGALLWVGVSLFVAAIRAAYLTMGDSLLERSGVGATMLTLGWLIVVLAVGTVVLLRSATRYNPYLKNLRAARARVAKLRAALVAKHGDVVVARFDMDRAREAEAQLAEQWAGKRAEQDGFAAELKHHYQHHLARDLANPMITDGVEITIGRTYRPEQGELKR
ncbi:MAG: hypothetical protein ACRDTG_20185 [Pseudonocardiaceae bacterium]